MLKQIFGGIFNLNVKGWLGFNQIKQSSLQTKDLILQSFTIRHSAEKKTFLAVMQEFNLNEADLIKKAQELKKLTNIYLLVSSCIFLYSLAIAYNGFIGQFMIGLALTILSLTNCFKYSYFRFQIQQRKLGVSLKEWFTGEFR